MPQFLFLSRMFIVPPSCNRLVIRAVFLTRGSLRMDWLWVSWSGQGSYCLGIKGKCLGFSQVPQMVLTHRKIREAAERERERVHASEFTHPHLPGLVKNQHHQIKTYFRGIFSLNPETQSLLPWQRLRNPGKSPPDQRRLVFTFRVVCLFALKIIFFFFYFNKGEFKNSLRANLLGCS